MSDLVITEKENIVAIADAVRNKTGKTNEMTLGEIASEISGITSAGGNEVRTGYISIESASIAYPLAIYCLKNDYSLLVNVNIERGSYEIAAPALVILEAIGSDTGIVINGSAQPGCYKLSFLNEDKWLNKSDYNAMSPYGKVYIVADAGCYIKVEYVSTGEDNEPV